MSSAGVRKILQKKTVEVFDFKLYTLKSALIFAVMLLSCVVDSGAVKLFSPLFSLS